MKVIRSSQPNLFFSKKEDERIVQAIDKAERETSGEIRVHLERKFRGDTMAHAKEIFERLGMTNTKDRNGVLILLGIKTKRFVILGDKGIHERLSQAFWDQTVQVMSRYFKEDRFADGLIETIALIGDHLNRNFPYRRDAVDELPDEISYSL